MGQAQQVNLFGNTTSNSFDDLAAPSQAPNEKISTKQIRDLPPMLKHYLEVKSEFPDRLIFYQVGDFFEVFFDDAITVSDSLSIRLTSRDKDQENPIPMCGVPIHAFGNYSKKLLDLGLGCVVVEQVEDAGLAKGLVKRDITKILTPGVCFEGEREDQSELNYILSVIQDSKKFSVCAIEASTGKIVIHNSLNLENLINVVQRYFPKEIVLKANQSDKVSELITNEVLPYLSQKIRLSVFDNQKTETELNNLLILSESVKTEFIDVCNISSDIAKESLYLLLAYIAFVSRCDGFLVSSIREWKDNAIMKLDGSTIKNLELLCSYDGTKEFSLFGVVDKTRTALGSRQLKEWILQPILSKQTIEKRLDQVETYLNNPNVLESIRKALYEVRDLERICTKLISGKIAPYDLGLLLKSLKVVPTLRSELSSLKSSEAFSELILNLKGIPHLLSLLEEALLDQLPLRSGEGPVFRDTFNAELNRLRSLESGSKNIIAEIELAERKTSGINSLKIKHNSVLGYFIEVPISNADKVPPNYIRKQTLSNAERFFTPELKDLEKEIFAATNKIEMLERSLFIDIKKACLECVTQIQEMAQTIGELDALSSFAVVSKENSYVRPILLEESKSTIVRGRHPVVEKSIGRARFVPNDLNLDERSKFFAVLTGPNMGGKSTYLRQTGVIQILAQAGCFVPAEKAELGLVDQIFTRIGSGDSLAKGDSTFMVEMKEASLIASAATNRSLVLVDELGRGTATKDGYSLALAIAEWLIEKVGSRTIFATHFHELNQLESKFQQVVCMSVGIVETISKIEFTHKIEMKPAEKSYGIHVARLAGIPNPILKRASKIAEELASEGHVIGHSSPVELNANSLNEISELTSFVDIVSSLEPDSLTPKNALEMIYDVVERARQIRNANNE